MKAKIISFEEAKKMGLTTDQETIQGDAAVGAMCVAEKGPDGQTVLLEKYIQRADGKKDLVFMHEKRQRILTEKNKFDKYTEQFDFIKGKERVNYIKNNKLVITPDQEVEENRV